MTYDYTSIESILALDCGSTATQAILIDRVDGEYRMIARSEAPSTVGPPWNNVATSVLQALHQLSEVTGWNFLDGQGRIITPEQQSGGVDAVVAITSAGRPLHLVLAGIMDDVSLLSARRALSTSYAVVDGIISLDRRADGMHRVNDDIEGQIQMIQDLEPDAIVIVGGVDGGAKMPVLQAAEAVALACSTLPAGAQPPVIYAGNADLRSQIADIIGSDSELRSVDNVRPSVDREHSGPLQVEIGEMYRRQKMERLPGMATLMSWSPVQVLPAAKAFSHTIQYLARLNGINVLGADVGGSSVTIATVVDEQLDLSIRSDLGLSCNIAHILDLVPLESILRWLPIEIDPDEARDILHNKALRYRTVPQTRQDLLLEQAVAREILRLVQADIASGWPKGTSTLYPDLPPKFHLILGGGGVLANVPSYGQAALILLDALQPIGVSGLALDRARLAGPLGAVAMLNPLAAAEVVTRDGTLSLGTVVAPVGSAREGETALTFKIEYEDERALEVEVPYGSLEVIPLPTGQTAVLELRPTRRFDVGLGTKGQAGTTKVEGGVIGIIIDARGRPLPFVEDPEKQRERIQRWLWDMGS